jgi:hypothetical protein
LLTRHSEIVEPNMPMSVIMPALEMAQDTRILVSWRRKEGETVIKGEIVLEIETDKFVIEVEALADGVLAGVKAQPSDVIPVVRRPPELVQKRRPARCTSFHSYPDLSLSVFYSGATSIAGGSRR